jgi:hypothetical protein
MASWKRSYARTIWSCGHYSCKLKAETHQEHTTDLRNLYLRTNQKRKHNGRHCHKTVGRCLCVLALNLSTRERWTCALAIEWNYQMRQWFWIVSDVLRKTILGLVWFGTEFVCVYFW